MNIRRVGNNETELTQGEWTVLFSYETPVAAHCNGKGLFKTEKFHSVTTSRHINKWLGNQAVSNHSGFNTQAKPQSFFDDLKDSF